MTKKLAELLNLPEISEGQDSQRDDVTLQETLALIDENKDMIAEVDNALSKIDTALPLVTGLDQADIDMDELSTFAKSKAEDMIDLAFNVDPRFAGPIFQTASVLLGHAITAKTNKMDKKLKMISLQLQKARLDHQIKKDAEAQSDGTTQSDSPLEGKGIVLDRNALLAEVLKKHKPQSDA